MNKAIILSSIAAALLSTTAAASPVDDSVSQSKAESTNMVRALETMARHTRTDGGVYVELAQAYWNAGRTADAMSAYRHALALDNAMLETRTGDAIWSHDVARSAINAEARLSAR